MTTKYLTAKEVSAELGISIRAAYEVMEMAGIQPIGRAVRVSRENLDAWLRAERERRRPSPLVETPPVRAPLIKLTYPRTKPRTSLDENKGRRPR
jgi:hypothetical protein